jgi:hypothetical protein
MKQKKTKQDNREIKYGIKPIVILKPINFLGNVAVKLMRFAGWLFVKTGNEK